MATILAVEDNPMISKVFELMLKKGGYKPIVVLSGKQALAVLEERKPDLILLDIMMEEMDGWQTLTAIRNDETNDHIPVVMLTAKSITPQEAMEYKDFIAGYLLKPVTQGDLFPIIESVLSKREHLKQVKEDALKKGVSEEIIQEYRKLCNKISAAENLIKNLEASYMGSGVSLRSREEIEGVINALKESIETMKVRAAEIDSTDLQ